MEPHTIRNGMRTIYVAAESGTELADALDEQFRRLAVERGVKLLSTHVALDGGYEAILVVQGRSSDSGDGSVVTV